MRIKEYLISRLAYIFGVPAIAEYIFAFLSIGYPSGEPIPKVLMDFNILNIIRGLFTRFVVSTNLDWIWPFWMERQFYATSADFSSRGFNPASINTTNRNWTGIGTLETEYESVVDPRGLLTPYNNSWSLDCWIQYAGQVYSPAKFSSVEQKLLKNLPIVITTFTIKNKLQVTLTAFVEYNPDTKCTVTYQKAEVQNISGETIKDAAFAFAFRPYNTEGISLINTLHFHGGGEVFINGRLAAVLTQIPNGVTTSSLSRGDVKHFFDEGKSNKLFDFKKSRVGMATGIAVYKLELEPGESHSHDIRMPNDPKIIAKLKHNRRTEEFVTALRKKRFDVSLKEQLNSWETKLKEGMAIKLPEQRIQDCFEANKAFMLMFYDNTYITPGPSTYHDFWFRDAAYLLNGLDKLGYHQETENVLNTYPGRIHASGFFFSQQGEWDSNGQAIWSLVEHFRLTKNKEFLQKMFPIIDRGARWIGWKAQTNLKTDPGYKGIMPPGLSAEHFGLNDYYYWDDFWALKGLADASYTANILNKKQKNVYDNYYTTLSNNIDVSLQYVEARLGEPIMPISPSRRMDSAAIGCLASYYPCRIYKPNDIRLTNTVRHIHENFFVNGGFFHDVNHSGHGTYLHMHVAQCYLGTRDPQALPVFDWIINIASPTWCWPEAIHPRTLGGTIGDGHHGWAAADICLLIRNMLLMEEDNALIITPVVPKAWYAPGETISVSKAPTYFGNINYSIKADKNKTFTLTLANNYTEQPRCIEWNLPFTILEATVDGKKAEPTAKTRLMFSAKAKKIRVKCK